MTEKIYGTIGAIGRFKPLHEGAARMLESMCEQAEHVIIGIGSANKYNMRNPFSPYEVENMINAYLAPQHNNYEIVHIDDFAHLAEFSDGQRWRQEIVEKFGALDAFVSGNEYIRELLSNDYEILESYKIVPEERRIAMRGTMVRAAMAQNSNWQDFIPKTVADYITSHKLDERFRTEFGLQTLVETAEVNFYQREDSLTERNHTLEA